MMRRLAQHGARGCPRLPWMMHARPKDVFLGPPASSRQTWSRLKAGGPREDAYPTSIHDVSRQSDASPPRRHVALLAALAVGAALELAGCGVPAASEHKTTAVAPAAASTTPAPTATATIAPAAGTVKPQKRLPGVAAVVNGEIVPMWEYRALLTLNAQADGITSTAPAGPASAAIRARTARQIVDESLLNAYARAHGVAVSPATVDARVAVYRMQGGAGFATSLAHLGVSSVQFRRLVERNLNAQAVTQRVINRITAPLVQVQVIQIVVPSQQQAQQVHDTVTHGADAMLLAAQKSSDPYIRRLAGQLPPLTRARGDATFGPAWDRVAFTVPAGAVSAPVHLNDGWAVLQVVERQPATATMERTLSTFIDALRRGAGITSYVQ